MPVSRCSRLNGCRPRAGSTPMCCRLPWHQRRSRAAYSVSEGGDSSKLPPSAGAMWIAQPPRRLDEVMAQDVPADRARTLQLRQARMVREGARANDGVVAPVVAVGAVPP